VRVESLSPLFLHIGPLFEDIYLFECNVQKMSTLILKFCNFFLPFSRIFLFAMATRVFLRKGTDLRCFDAVVCGEDVTALKPDPEVYKIALQRLGLPAERCLAFEDTRNGVDSAIGAGLRVVVTPSLYSAGQDFSTATTVLEDLSHFRLSPAVRS
jgi:hypothetical protein